MLGGSFQPKRHVRPLIPGQILQVKGHIHISDRATRAVTTRIILQLNRVRMCVCVCACARHSSAVKSVAGSQRQRVDELSSLSLSTPRINKLVHVWQRRANLTFHGKMYHSGRGRVGRSSGSDHDVAICCPFNNCRIMICTNPSSTIQQLQVI